MYMYMYMYMNMNMNMHIHVHICTCLFMCCLPLRKPGQRSWEARSANPCLWRCLFSLGTPQGSPVEGTPKKHRGLAETALDMCSSIP